MCRLSRRGPSIAVIPIPQATLKATNVKSARLDVYGQPRGEMPRMFRRDEADASLNERYLEVEGGPLRATKNSSASLIRLAGEAS